MCLPPPAGKKGEPHIYETRSLENLPDGRPESIEPSTREFSVRALVDDPVRAEDGWVGGIFAGKGSRKEDWPQNSTVKAHFDHRMGSLYVDLKSSTDKDEEDLFVFSKMVPGGRELCGSFKCEKTPEDGDD